jgi:predicted lipid-binding transport protein (Tim44 family)
MQVQFPRETRTPTGEATNLLAGVLASILGLAGILLSGILGLAGILASILGLAGILLTGVLAGVLRLRSLRTAELEKSFFANKTRRSQDLNHRIVPRRTETK